MQILAPLRDRNFCKLFAGRSISLLGTGIGRIALAFFAYHLSPKHASLVVGIALVINMLTYIIFAPLYGHYAPRLPRKIFLISMDVCRALLLVVVPFVTQVWQLYLLIFLINVFSAGFTPLYQAVIPEMLKDEQQYSQGLVLSRLTYTVETLLSPALTAVLLMAFSFHLLFFLNAATYGLSALLLISTTFPMIKSMGKEVKRHVLSGIQQYYRNRTLVACLLLVMISTLAGATVIVNTVAFLHGIYAQAQSVTATAMLFYGAGSVCFGLLMPRLRARFSEYRLMLFGAILIIVTNLLALAIHQWWYLFFIWFLLGVGTMAVEGLLSVIVNRFANQETRTALFAANFSLTHACWLLGYLFTALLGNLKSLPVYFISLASIALLLLLLAVLVAKRKS